MSGDITATLQSLARRELSACGLIDQSLAACGSSRSVFVRTFGASATAAAEAADRAHKAGSRALALGGLAVSIKDLFDVAGYPTTGGSVVLSGRAPASTDSACVARLRSAGAALIGHTSMTEFAYSGLGLNPHHGTPANPATGALDSQPRIPGGSSSGAVVSVASGSAWAALGTDTGGSLRIPAALCGLVGFKGTQAMTPRQGLMPLAPSLDTAGAITHSVRDAVLLQEILSAQTLNVQKSDVRALRLLVPRPVFQDGMDLHVATSVDRALFVLRTAGATIVERGVDGLADFDTVKALSGIVAHEAFSLHRNHLSSDGELYDPRVALRIRRGEAVTHDSYQALLKLRHEWRLRVDRDIGTFDAVLVPTVPTVAPRLLPLIDDDELFASTNLQMLRNPSVVNHLDGCAISLPCHSTGEMPVGLMLFASAGKDGRLLGVALAVEAALARVRRGALPVRDPLPPPA